MHGGISVLSGYVPPPRRQHAGVFVGEAFCINLPLSDKFYKGDYGESITPPNSPQGFTNITNHSILRVVGFLPQNP